MVVQINRWASLKAPVAVAGQRGRMVATVTTIAHCAPWAALWVVVVTSLVGVVVGVVVDTVSLSRASSLPKTLCVNLVGVLRPP